MEQKGGINIKGCLENLRQMKDEIERNLEKIQEYKEMLRSIYSMDYSDKIRVSKENHDADFVIILEKIEVLEEVTKPLILDYYEKKLDKRLEISKLDNAKERKVLTLRYIEGLLWKEVRQKMKISKSYLLKVHNQALENFENLKNET